MGYARGGAWPAWPKQGGSPIPHRRAAHRPISTDRRRVAGGGGARELTPQVKVPIWGIGGGGAHRGGLTVVRQVSGGSLATAGRRRGGGRRLTVRGVTVSSGGGRCGDGGAHWWSEVAVDGKAALATEGGSRLGASTVSCGGRWLSGRLGVAQRRLRAVRGGQHFSAWSRGAR
jgi:hypothetical protein